MTVINDGGLTTEPAPITFSEAALVEKVHIGDVDCTEFPPLDPGASQTVTVDLFSPVPSRMFTVTIGEATGSVGLLATVG